MGLSLLALGLILLETILARREILGSVHPETIEANDHTDLAETTSIYSLPVEELRIQNHYDLFGDEGSLGEDRIVTDTNPKDSRHQRIARLIVFWVAYGFLLDLGIYFARFNRANESHDEFHAFIMFVTFTAGIAMDIWYSIIEWKQLTDGTLYSTIYLGLMCYVDLIAIPQIVLGNIVRFKMRNPKAGRSYPTTRLLHRISGILLYLGCKAKLLIMHCIEDESHIIFKQEERTLEWIFVGYAIGLLLFWITIILIYRVFPEKFRHKAIQDNDSKFDAQEKSTHMKLLDIRTDLMVLVYLNRWTRT